MVDADYDFWAKRLALVTEARRLGYRLGSGEIDSDMALARFREFEQALNTVQIVRHDGDDKPLLIYVN